MFVLHPKKEDDHPSHLMAWDSHKSRPLHFAINLGPNPIKLTKYFL
jgi:hypothetical protein